VISAATRVAAVIGNPVYHSLSPALHNAAFEHLGVDWVYVALHVATGEGQRAIDAMRTLQLAGLSVTMPHKEIVARSVDELDPAAEALHSVNTVVPQLDGSLKGYSTDGAGFVASLVAEGIAIDGMTVCLLGAGGAARAIADALARAGAGRIAVLNRTISSAQETVALAGAVGVLGTAGDVREADLVVNATSIGMGSQDLPCDPSAFRVGQVVADIVYHPRDTALLQAAKSVGAVAIGGLGMLVHQAALQQQLWHGLRPDVAVMQAAAERELTERRQ
jgi:shikimate dehydrogenase